MGSEKSVWWFRTGAVCGERQTFDFLGRSIGWDGVSGVSGDTGKWESPLSGEGAGDVGCNSLKTHTYNDEHHAHQGYNHNTASRKYWGTIATTTESVGCRAYGYPVWLFRCF